MVEDYYAPPLRCGQSSGSRNLNYVLKQISTAAPGWYVIDSEKIWYRIVCWGLMVNPSNEADWRIRPMIVMPDDNDIMAVEGVIMWTEPAR